jgi:hypothetical protein
MPEQTGQPCIISPLNPPTVGRFPLLRRMGDLPVLKQGAFLVAVPGHITQYAGQAEKLNHRVDAGENRFFSR